MSAGGSQCSTHGRAIEVETIRLGAFAPRITNLKCPINMATVALLPNNRRTGGTYLGLFTLLLNELDQIDSII